VRALLCLGFFAYFAIALAGCKSRQQTRAKLTLRMPSGTYVMQHDARPRKYILRLPAGREDEDGLPLVLALHGGPGNARNLQENTLLNAKADSAGFIVVYPDGTSATDPAFLNWNPGHCCGYAWANKIDDTGFIRQLALRVAREYAADRRRIYLAGFSKGAMMAYRLACDAGEVFTGIADISGAMNVDRCNPPRPLDVFISHGRNDMNVLYGGPTPKVVKPLADNEDRPVSYAVDFWRRINNCVPGGMRFRGNAEIQTYVCRRGALKLVSLNGEGHTWPGSLIDLAGANMPTWEVSVNDLMWNFWQEAHERRYQPRL